MIREEELPPCQIVAQDPRLYIKISFGSQTDPSIETEVLGNAHQGGKRNSWDGQEGGLKQTSLEGTEALLSSLWVCLHCPMALLPVLLPGPSL